MSDTTTPKKARTITLSGMRPVTIREDQWPIIAESNWSEHDGKVEVQANRRARATIKVRQHEDGRALVYGVYGYRSLWPDESDVEVRAGYLLNSDATTWDFTAVIQKIRETRSDLQMYESLPAGWQPDWQMLEDECIANLPAVNI
jgi:hypothetical protein